MDTNFSQPAIFSEVSTPTAPESGYLKVYAKSGALCSMSNSGSENSLLGGSTGSSNNKFLFSSGTGGTTIKASVTTSPNNYVCAPEIDEGLSGPRFILNKGVTTSQICGLEVSSSQQLMLWGNWVQLYNARLLPLYYSSQSLELGASDGACFIAGSTNSGAWNWASSAGGLHVSNNVFSRTTASRLRVYTTFTSTTSFEAIEIKGNSSSAYQIGSAVGSAGGSNRAIQFGHWNAAGSFTSSLSINTTANQVQIGNILFGYNTTFSTGVYGLNLNNNTPNVTIWSGDSSSFGSSFSGNSVFMVGPDVNTLSGYGIGSYSKITYSSTSTLSIPQFCVGNPSGFSGLDLALGTTGTPSDGEYTVTSGYGSNKSGASMWLMAGRSTGTGTGGSVNIGSSVSGSSGSTRNSNTTIAQFSPSLITFSKPVITTNTLVSPSLTPLILLQIWG